MRLFLKVQVVYVKQLVPAAFQVAGCLATQQAMPHTEHASHGCFIASVSLEVSGEEHW